MQCIAPGILKRLVGCQSTGGDGTHEQIIPARHARLLTAKELTQPAFHPVPHDGVADGFAHREPEANHTFFVAASIDGEIRRS
jgi:hypothetical protein